MLGAIGRYIGAFFLLLTGQIDAARKKLSSRPEVMAAEYDGIIKANTSRINVCKTAVGTMLAQVKNKEGKLKKLYEEISKLTQMKAGAQKMAQRLAQKFTSPDEAAADPEFTKCKTAFADFSSTLVEKEKRVEELEEFIKNNTKKVDDHKNEIKTLIRELDDLKAEKGDAIADVTTAKAMTEASDMISGIAEDGSAAKLAELREMRQNIVATAEVSSDLAGLDSKKDEREFMDALANSEADDAFMAGMDFAAAPTETTPQEATGDSKIPE